MTLTTYVRPRPRHALDTDALVEVAEALLAARQVWHGSARFDPRHRWPVRLLGDDLFEAWVIGWFSGQSLGMHDHGDSAAAIVVAEGRLHETTVVDTEHGPVQETHALARGVVRSISPGTVHGVANLDTHSATSLHIYSPPLDRMTHFEADGVRPVETVGVEPEAPLLPAAVGRLLRIARHV